jgi:hypothetical protein
MIKVMYHGTHCNFQAFDRKKIGSVNGTGAGFGFYFGTRKRAEVYGTTVMRCSLYLMRPVSNKRITLPMDVIRGLLRDSGYMDNYERLSDAVRDIMQGCTSDTEILGDIINATGSYVVLDLLRTIGYNYTNDGKDVIMFCPEDIKIL